MSVELQEEEGGKILVVKMSGKLTKDDYARLVPEAERLIKEHGKLRFLCEMHDFHGWGAGALWQELKFDIRHFADVERVAFIGDRAWEHGLAVFCKPFTMAKVRYFDQSKADEARAWIHADLPVPASHPSATA